MTRRISKQLRSGNVTVGGDAPIVVQSMTKTDTRDIPVTINQIKELEDSGCEIVRLAVPDREAAESLAAIKRSVSLPLIADIHFDYRLALAALRAGVDGLRLNPGNIGDKEQIARVVAAAKEREVPIRIGVNAGSLPASFQPKTPLPKRMVNMALEQIRLMESLDFDLIKVSLKTFDVPATIRVSLTAHPCEEVFVAYEILKSMGLRQRGPTLVSCPSCGRAEVDVIALAEAVRKRLEKLSTPV